VLSSKINIIDVGAVGGFDPPWSAHQDKVGRSLSFEPNEPAVLHGDHLRYNTAIWNADGDATFHVSGPKGVGSSLLKQNVTWVEENFDRLKKQGNRVLNQVWFHHAVIDREFPGKVNKLDTVLAELRRAIGDDLRFHFLKSDTQSGEYFVLQGAQEFIETDCIGLELELFRYPLYEGLVTEDEVKDFLYKRGFEVAGWTGYMNSFLASADYLFLRRAPRNETEAQQIQCLRDVYRPRGRHLKIKQLSFTHRCLTNLSLIKQNFLRRQRS